MKTRDRASVDGFRVETLESNVVCLSVCQSVSDQRICHHFKRPFVNCPEKILLGEESAIFPIIGHYTINSVFSLMCGGLRTESRHLPNI